jgi:D-3-phosphoglycerate dehydrogenase
MNILIADAVSAAAVDVFRAQPDWNVIVSSPKEYEAHLATADALLIRSAVTVTKEVLAKAPKLRVIGRAGVGVDNVDQEAATSRGVVVMNTPGGNAISVAEHTMALMLALARSISNASASTKGGKWEKKKFLGTELNGKTLGVIGLGNIGMDAVVTDQPPISTALYSGCTADAVVEVVTIVGGTHTWPRVDTLGVDGSQLVLSFFGLS